MWDVYKQIAKITLAHNAEVNQGAAPYMGLVAEMNHQGKNVVLALCRYDQVRTWGAYECALLVCWPSIDVRRRERHLPSFIKQWLCKDPPSFRPMMLL